jgi:histone acetyltransferase (RNA polymerase elongator complex component)
MYEDRLSGRITMDMYDKKLKDFEIRKKEAQDRFNKIGRVDKSDYITAKSILSLAQRAPEIFKSSEPEEKRQFINFLFQNLELDGKNLDFKLKAPFNTVLLANKSKDCSIWGG